MLRIKLIRSVVGHNWRNRATIQALGLKKMHQVVEKEDTQSIRGMITRVRNMLLVETEDGSKPFADASHLTSSSRPIRHKSFNTTTGKTVVPVKRVISAPTGAAAPKATKAKVAKVVAAKPTAVVAEKKPRKTAKKTEGEKA